MKTQAKADLPRIIRFDGMHDGGPCDDGPTATCPHCGADGRYVFWFDCEDGTHRGAMSGCIKLFPVSPVAEVDRKLIEKLHDLQKRYGKETTLNSWQRKIREAIDAFYAGDADEAQTLRTIQQQNAAMQAYRANKHGKAW